MVALIEESDMITHEGDCRQTYGSVTNPSHYGSSEERKPLEFSNVCINSFGEDEEKALSCKAAATHQHDAVGYLLTDEELLQDEIYGMSKLIQYLPIWLQLYWWDEDEV